MHSYYNLYLYSFDFEEVVEFCKIIEMDVFGFLMLMLYNVDDGDYYLNLNVGLLKEI